MTTTDASPADQAATIASLRQSLGSESTPLAVRFRALFSLKHLAQTSDDAATAVAAIEAIADAFKSPSALLKHELAYCLGQTGNAAAVKPLRDVLSDLQEDPMCRHEAAEALGALGTAENLELLKQFRDREGEEIVVKETCEIAIDRIEWETSKDRQTEKLRARYEPQVKSQCKDAVHDSIIFVLTSVVTSPLSTLPPQCPNQQAQWKS